MAAPSVTFSFSNGTIIQAGEVNQNFTDLINGASDGTKDYTINILTTNAAVTFNGILASRAIWTNASNQLSTNGIDNAKLILGTGLDSEIFHDGTNLHIDPEANGSTTALIINESGADVDFRIEGDTATQLFVCDASTDSVEIGTTVQGVIAKFTGSGIIFNEAGDDRDFRVEGVTASQLLVLDAGNNRVEIGTTSQGAIARFTDSAIAFNENANDIDFRVEGITATQLLVCDASANSVEIGGAVQGDIAIFNSSGLVVSSNVDASTFSTGNETFTYNEDTFTATGTGFSGTAPTATSKFKRIGDIVFLNINVIIGTSNATTFTITGLPPEIRPSSTIEAFYSSTIEDNGNSKPMGEVLIQASGTLEMSFWNGTFFSNVWTASGNKSSGNVFISYGLF